MNFSRKLVSDDMVWMFYTQKQDWEMIIYKSNKFKVLLKIIATVLIQAFLVMDFAFCGMNEICTAKAQTKSSTLAPEINIDAKSIQHAFLKGVTPQNNPELIPPTKRNVIEKHPSSILNSERKVIATAMLAVMFLGPIVKAMPAFAMAPRVEQFTNSQLPGVVKAVENIFKISIVKEPEQETAPEKYFYDEPYDLILDFGRQIKDENALNRYGEILEKHNLLNSARIIHDEKSTKIVIVLGEPRGDILKRLKELNRSLKGLKKFSNKPSTIIWKETRVYQEIEKFVDEIVEISEELKVDKIDKHSLIEALEAITFIESRFSHWKKLKSGALELVTSDAGALGITQLMLESAVKEIVFLVFGRQEHIDSNKPGGYIEFENIKEELKSMGADYIKKFTDARSNNEKKEEIVRQLINATNNELVGDYGIYTNIYYVLAVWQKLVVVEESVIKEVIDIIKKEKLKIDAPGKLYKPRNFTDAQKQFQKENFINNVVAKIVGEDTIKDINERFGTVEGKHNQLMNNLAQRVQSPDKADNQRIGYLYYFLLWLEAKSFSELYGVDQNLFAAGGYNGGNSVKEAVKEFGKNWFKFVVGKSKKNPEETKGYIRKYVEFLLQYKGTVSKERYDMMHHLINDHYQKVKQENRLFNNELAAQLAVIVGSDYVNRFSNDFGQRWEEKILSTDKTFARLARKIVYQQDIFQDDAEKLRDYLKEKYPEAFDALNKEIEKIKASKSESLKQKLLDYAGKALTAAGILTGVFVAVVILWRILKYRARFSRSQAKIKQQSPRTKVSKRYGRSNIKPRQARLPKKRLSLFWRVVNHAWDISTKSTKFFSAVKRGRRVFPFVFLAVLSLTSVAQAAPDVVQGISSFGFDSLLSLLVAIFPFISLGVSMIRRRTNDKQPEDLLSRKIDGTPDNFISWTDDIIDESTQVLIEAEVSELGKELKIPSLKKETARAKARARACIQFIKKLARDKKHNVYILRDAVGLYSAHKMLRPDDQPSAIYLSKESLKGISGGRFGVDILIGNLINKVTNSKVVSDKDAYKIFREGFFKAFAEEVERNDNLRQAISMTLRYLEEAGILNKAKQGIRFIDTTQLGTMPLFLEAIFNLDLKKIGLWKENLVVSTETTETLMYYSRLFPAISITNSYETADAAQALYYPVEFAEEFDSGAQPILKETNKKDKNLYYFQTVILRNEILADNFNLKRYSDNKLLEVAWDYIRQKVQNSPVKKDVIFHNPKHWNNLLEFAEAVFNNPESEIFFKDTQDKEWLLTLIRLAVYFHDVGYYEPKDGKFTKQGHEKRSIEEFERFAEFLKQNYGELNLDEGQIEVVKYLIGWTEFILGDEIKQGVYLVDKILIDLEQFKNEKRKNISSRTTDYLNTNLPSLIGTPEGKARAFSVLFAGKVMAVADIYSHANDQVTKIPGLWYEFKIDNVSAQTILEQIAGSYDFMTKFTTIQRLNYLYGKKRKFGVFEFIPDELKNQRKQNELLMKKINYLVNKLKNNTFTEKDKQKLIQWIDSLAIDVNAAKFKERMKREIDLIMLREWCDRSRVCNLKNKQRFFEDLVGDLKAGKNLQIAYVNIQNFKEEFNARGDNFDKLVQRYGVDIIGKGFGDFGIQAVAKYLPVYLQSKLKYAKINFKVYNDAKSYWIIFENVTDSSIISGILKELFIGDSEFKKAVVKEVTDRVTKRIKRAIPQIQSKLVLRQPMSDKEAEEARKKAEEESCNIAEKLVEELEKFTTEVLNFYVGAVLHDKQEQSADAVSEAQFLVSQLTSTAKLAQINLTLEKLSELSEKHKQKPELIMKVVKKIVERAKKEKESSLKIYNGSTAKEINKLGELGQKEELESIDKFAYNPDTTYSRLLEELDKAIDDKADEKIGEIKAKVFGKTVIYLDSDAVPDLTKPIFIGNERFKDIVIYMVLNGPAFDWAGTFRTGGDELSKIVWNVKTQETFIYRFDINNLGALNNQWGANIGDRLINEILKLIDKTTNHATIMEYIYNYFNATELSWELSKDEYNELEQKLKNRNKPVKEYLKTENSKYYLIRVPPVLVKFEFTEEITREKIETVFESSPVVSAGVVKIDARLIQVKKEKGVNIERDYSEIQGRAWSKEDQVKDALKKLQAKNNGLIPSFTEANKLMVAEPYQINALGSFKEKKLSHLSNELIEFELSSSRIRTQRTGTEYNPALDFVIEKLSKDDSFNLELVEQAI